MDLRLRLLLFQVGVLFALLLAFSVGAALDLRADVTAEVKASFGLVDLMLGVSDGSIPDASELERRFGAEMPRHLKLQLDRSNLEQPFSSATASRFSAILDRLAGTGDIPARRIPLEDGRVLLLSPDPRAEVREVLVDSSRALAAFAGFALLSMLAAWRVADRALRPARALEEGLQRLARGEDAPCLPAFRLVEYQRIAEAIERLAAALAAASAKERHLSRRLIEVQESERCELARELHDDFGQTVTAIRVAAAFVQRHAGTAAPAAITACGADIQRASEHLATQLRGLLRQLRPQGIQGLGLSASLSELVDGWRRRMPETEIDADIPVLPVLPERAGLALYRTLQEGLTNVARHAGATQVRIRVRLEGSGVLLTLDDDGGGRATAVGLAAGGGLSGMRERSFSAGGALKLEDSPLGGLGLRLRLPVDSIAEPMRAMSS